MTINVTSRDIQKGKHDGNSCPVALAMICNGLSSVSVSQQHLLWIRGPRSVENCRSLSTPLHVAQFVRAFDADNNVSPFSFELPE